MVDKEEEEFPEPEIYNLTNEMLTTECDKFDFNNPIIHPVHLSNSLTLTREKYNGIGLAANQVGINTRVVSIKGFDSAFFNPVITTVSDEQVVMEEGCLSYPGLAVKIKRPEIVRVRFSDAYGETQTKMFTGMSARIVQHEIDHINGIIFYNRANRFHRDQAFRRWKNTK